MNNSRNLMKQVNVKDVQMFEDRPIMKIEMSEDHERTLLKYASMINHIKDAKIEGFIMKRGGMIVFSGKRVVESPIAFGKFATKKESGPFAVNVSGRDFMNFVNSMNMTSQVLRDPANEVINWMHSYCRFAERFHKNNIDQALS